MKRFRVLIIMVILIAIGAGAYWYFSFRKEEKPVVLQTVRAQYGYISRSVTATGTIQPVDTVTVGSQVSGTIKNIYADYNSKVKKGQLIAQLDKSLLLAAAEQYRANLELAKSQLIYQKSAYDREKILFDSSVISKQELETALFNYNSAKATVASVQAQLDAANKNLSYTNIYSPVDGVVMTRNVSIGQTVAASFNTPTLFIIAKDITKMQVQGAIDEADIGNVKLGQNVTFTVDAYPDDIFSGTVSQIRLEPTVSANVVTYPTIISAPNDKMKLKPGMTANITVFTKEDTNALLVPSKVLKFQPSDEMAKQYKIGERMIDSPTHKKRPGADSAKRKTDDTTNAVKRTKAFVWVKKDDSLIQKRVVIGLNDDTNAEVLFGLTTEDEVVEGIENATTDKSAKTSTQRSPFMPPRRNTTPAKPQASGNK